MVTPKRGDVYWVNLDPTVGTEIKKRRPAIVVSNNAANRRFHQVTILPLTSKETKRVESFQAFISCDELNLGRDSKALAEQIRTISKRRVSSFAGRVADETMNAIDQAIRIHLGLQK